MQSMAITTRAVMVGPAHPLRKSAKRIARYSARSVQPTPGTVFTSAVAKGLSTAFLSM